MMYPGSGNEYRPLIETPALQRVSCYKDLPKFLEEVASMIRVEERISIPKK